MDFSQDSSIDFDDVESDKEVETIQVLHDKCYMNHLDDLITELETKVSKRGEATDRGGHLLYPMWLSANEIKQAELTLNMTLPPLLRRLYMQVGNGGWGPGYGLYPLLAAGDIEREELNIVDMVSSHTWFKRRWTELHLLPFCDWGCAIHSNVDCSKPNLPGVRSDPNDDTSAFGDWLENELLENWLRAWVRGEKVFVLSAATSYRANSQSGDSAG